MPGDTPSLAGEPTLELLTGEVFLSRDGHYVTFQAKCPFCKGQFFLSLETERLLTFARRILEHQTTGDIMDVPQREGVTG